MTDFEKQRLVLLLTDKDFPYSIEDILVAGIRELEGQVQAVRAYERNKQWQKKPQT